jgi:hypothetical protein
MADPTRTQWLQTLEIIVTRQPDQAEAEWAWVMEHLGLGPEYFLGVLEAVRQGRWREAENPGAYLKTAARREQRRLTAGGERRPPGIRGMRGLDLQGEEITLGRDGWTGPEGEALTSEELLDHMEYRRGSGRTVRDPDGVWRASAWPSGEPSRAARLAAELDTALSQGMASAAKRHRRRPRPQVDPSQPGLLDRYAQRLQRMQAASGKDERDEPYINSDPEPVPDWRGLADRAELTEWERKVVEYKLRGTSRDEALAEQGDEASRKALQAAWKRMQRTGEERLRKNIFPQDVPEGGANHTG